MEGLYLIMMKFKAMNCSKKNKENNKPPKLNKRDKPEKTNKPESRFLRFIKKYKIEAMLVIMAVLSAAVYILLNSENGRREQELREESKRSYSAEVDIDEDSSDLVNTLYNDFYTVSKDIYFKYQVKYIGDTFSYYEIADSAVSGRVGGRINFVVTEVEKPEECSLIKKVSGGAYIKLKIKLENLMDEDCVVSINSWRLFIMDDDGYEVTNPAYQLNVSGLGPKLEECGDKLDCYFYSFGSTGVGQYAPAELNSYNMQWILLKKEKSITFNVYYEIPEEIIDDSRLVYSSGAALPGNEYNNMGFSVYLNRQSEE